MFSDELIQQIRDQALSVYEELLGGHIDVTRDPNAICPFHQDRTPSLYVSPDYLWYCQPCGIGGDVFRFLEKFENLETFPDAVRRAAEILGIDIPKGKRGYLPERDLRVVKIRQNVKRVREHVKAWWSSRLKDLVIRAQRRERMSSQMWDWATRMKVPPTDSLWDKIVSWSSEAKVLDEERRGLEEARDFEAQLLAFEDHYGKFAFRALGLSGGEWQDVRHQLLGIGRQLRRNPATARIKRTGGLFGNLAGKAEGDQRPEHVEARADEPECSDRPDNQ